MDYRLWIKGGNWEEFDEATLKEIDQAVAWGAKYGIHVSLNFHRAPGYTVAQPPEKTSLWTDPPTQDVCAKHWAMFARRYRGIPSERLSFNLMNEPSQVEPKAYVAVVRKLVQAIRGEDPDRLIVSDGLQWGTVPVLELRELRIAQATRGYTPFEITHYKASWVNGGHFPYPQWPRLLPPNGTLLSPQKPEGSHPLVIDGPFTTATELRLHVLTVSASALLVVEADGKQVFQKQFRCGPGKGEWKKAEFKKQWQIYQNLFDRDYTATIPAGSKQVRVRVVGWRLAANRPDRAEARQRRREGNHAHPQARVEQKAGTVPLRTRGARRSADRACHAGQGMAMEDLHRALERGGVQGDRRHGRGMGCVQQDAARRGATLGRGLSAQLAAGRLGLGVVELSRIVRCSG